MIISSVVAGGSQMPLRYSDNRGEERQAEGEVSPVDARVPVLIVTGTLGAGKTRLLSRLLAAPGQGPTALLVNEFANVGIDREVFASFGLAARQIPGGCICCVVRGEVRRSLQSLLFARARGEIAFLQVVIETSGVTDPVSLLAEFFEDGVLRRRFRLAGLVTVVDSTASAAALAECAVAIRQIALADRLLVSKGDLAEFNLDALRGVLAHINPSAAIDDVRAVSSVADLLGAVSGGGLRATPEASLPDHTARLRSYSIEADAKADGAAFIRFVEDMTERCGESLLRLKGMAKLSGYPPVTGFIDVVRGRFYPPQRAAASDPETCPHAVAIVEDVSPAVIAEIATAHGMLCRPA